MGKGWVRTSEQEAYLDGEFQSYLKARKDGEVKNWRSKLHEKWEERWPERQALINEWGLASDAQFDPAQMEALGEALAAQKTAKNAFIYHNRTCIEWAFFLATVQLCSLAHRCKTRVHTKPTNPTHLLPLQISKEQLQETQAEAYDD